MDYVIKKSMSNDKWVTLTDGQSQVLEIEGKEAVDTFMQNISERNPNTAYKAVAVGTKMENA